MDGSASCCRQPCLWVSNPWSPAEGTKCVCTKRFRRSAWGIYPCNIINFHKKYKGGRYICRYKKMGMPPIETSIELSAMNSFIPTVEIEFCKFQVTVISPLQYPIIVKYILHVFLRRGGYKSVRMSELWSCTWFVIIAAIFFYTPFPKTGF